MPSHMYVCTVSACEDLLQALNLARGNLVCKRLTGGTYPLLHLSLPPLFPPPRSPPLPGHEVLSEPFPPAPHGMQ